MTDLMRALALDPERYDVVFDAAIVNPSFASGGHADVDLMAADWALVHARLGADITGRLGIPEQPDRDRPGVVATPASRTRRVDRSGS